MDFPWIFHGFSMDFHGFSGSHYHWHIPSLLVGPWMISLVKQVFPMQCCDTSIFVDFVASVALGFLFGPIFFAVFGWYFFWCYKPPRCNWIHGYGETLPKSQLKLQVSEMLTTISELTQIHPDTPRYLLHFVRLSHAFLRAGPTA